MQKSPLLSAGVALTSFLSAQTISDFTLSGNDLSTIIVNGSTYSAGDLINSTLTAAQIA